jgi:hypothetical protein
MEYLCHKWPRICSTCRKHIPVHSSFLTYHRVCYYINTTGATSGAGTAYPSEHMISPPVFRGSCYSIFSFMCMFCRSLFVFLYVFFWTLCCLFFFDIQIMITPLVFLNSSFYYVKVKKKKKPAIVTAGTFEP